MVFLFLQISLTENWLIFITRAQGPFWSSIPSWQLSGAVLIVDVIATMFTLFGWWSQNWTDIVTVVQNLGFGHSVSSVLWVVLTTSCLPQNHSTTSVTVDQESHKETTDHWKISLFLCKSFYSTRKINLSLSQRVLMIMFA